MGSYYVYLISTLPMLNFGTGQAFSWEKFLSLVERFISEKEAQILREISLQPQAAPIDLHPTLKKWRDFDTRLRNELVKVRAVHKHLDASKYLRDYEYPDISLGHLALSVYRNPSILDGERMLDEARWRFLDELAFGHYFDLDFLIIYALKLLILERWEKISATDKVKAIEEVLS